MIASESKCILQNFRKKESNILGVMQPYLFPYFEQFRFISSCDLWIVFDTPQYVRKSWINRNRILNREKGWSYISVPVRHGGLDISIRDSLLDNTQNWRQEMINKLRVYENEAPQYQAVKKFLEVSLAAQVSTVSELNSHLLRQTCRFLEIDTPILIMSDLNITLPEKCAAGEWALVISKALGAHEYRNAVGGIELFDAKLYADNGIHLTFHQHISRSYRTGRFKFVDNLSIIDVLMWNDIPTLQTWLGKSN